MTDDFNDLEYVGFWARFGASIMDTVLLGIIVLPVLNVIYPGYWDDVRFVKGPADVLLNYLVPAVAVVAFWIARQATPGKMLIHARVVDAQTGAKPTTRQFVIRYLGYYVSLLPLCLGFFWVAFDPRKQGWHDKLANTVVVRPKDRGTKPVAFDRSP